MTISINQQVDFLWKKLGYNVAKTDVPSMKDATNESIPSSPFIPGDKIWSESNLIPTYIPPMSSPVVEVHNDALATTIQCITDVTATPNRTWFTHLTDWVPTTFGSTYQLKVYLAPPGTPNPQSVGIQLYAMGTNNNDEWHFDHEAGVLNFIGDNLPAFDFSTNVLFVSGARYIGRKGISSLLTGTFGNITISGSSITSTAGLNLSAIGSISTNNQPITNVGYPVLPTDAATVQYVADSLTSFQANVIWQGNTSVSVSDTGADGKVTVTIDGELISTIDSTGVTFSNLTLFNNTISSLGDLVLTPAANCITKVDSTSALKIPTGNTLERPLVSDIGSIRFNTTSGMLEVFNGSTWINTQASLSSQTLQGDGTTTSFTLDKAAYANNLLVITNGVVQTPSVAYVTSGNMITFADAPAVNDSIEIRFISQSVSSTTTVPSSIVVDSNTFAVGASAVTLDVFSIVAWKAVKYTVVITLSDNSTQLAEILVSHNGMSTEQVITSTGTVPLVDFTTGIIGPMLFFSAVSTTLPAQVRLHKTYF